MGPPGLQGFPGPQGLVGLPGVKGERGLTGAKGIQGNSGTPGRPGEPGPPGLTGLTGIKGARGEQGVKGDIGLMGPPGRHGESGRPVSKLKQLLKLDLSNIYFIRDLRVIRVCQDLQDYLELKVQSVILDDLVAPVYKVRKVCQVQMGLKEKLVQKENRDL